MKGPSKKLTPSRRSFIRAVGAGAASLPFFKLLEDSFARGAGETLPLRFIGVYHPHGVSAELWAMKGTDTESTFDIGYANCSLQPFDDAATYGKSFKDKIIAIEGIDLMSSANGHDTAATILTGSRIDGSARKPMNASLDQVLAIDKGLGSATRVTSIALGVGNDASDPGITLSYGAGGVALPKIINPKQAFDTLFGGFMPPTDDPVAAAAAARKRALGKSVIDFVTADIGRLNPRLAPAEKQKLDQHLSSLRDLEKRLGIGPTGPTGPTCVLPATPDASKFPKLKQYNGGEPYFDAITDAHVDLIAQAFACDITRFATLLMADLSYTGNPLGLPSDNHGAVAHTYSSSPVGANGAPVGAGSPDTWLPLAKFNRYSYGKIARLMQKLDALGALDSTIIYASSDMGNPALHSTRNVPTLLAGGVNNLFRMGRRLKVQADCPTSSPWCAPGDANFKPVTNSRVLVSIAQAFGVQINTFGTQPDVTQTTGALDNLV